MSRVKKSGRFLPRVGLDGLLGDGAGRRRDEIERLVRPDPGSSIPPSRVGARCGHMCHGSEPSAADGAFAQLDFKVENVLGGSPEYAAPGILNAELFMTDPRQYEQFKVKLPAERALVFLRNKAVEAQLNGWAPEGPDTGHLYYRIVSDQGVIRAVGGKAAAPDDGGGFLTAINGTSFDRVVAEVRAAAR